MAATSPQDQDRRSGRADFIHFDSDDTTLGAEVRGDGPALLFIHGFPLDRTIWKHQVATLARFKRIAPDLRGLGSSTAHRDGFSMRVYADDLVKLLDHLGVQRVVVAGLSMGGYIAFELLRRHRERVAGLILCDTRAGAETAEGRRGRDDMIALARRTGSNAIAERMLPKLLGRTTHQTQPMVVTEVRDMIRRAPVPGIVGALQAMKDRPDSTPLLADIAVPTLVVTGQEDELIPAAVSRELAAAIPGASFTTIAHAGHVPCLEAPTAVSRVFGEFLEAVRF